jgi:hypothetical protein
MIEEEPGDSCAARRLPQPRIARDLDASIALGMIRELFHQPHEPVARVGDEPAVKSGPGG